MAYNKRKQTGKKNLGAVAVICIAVTVVLIAVLIGLGIFLKPAPAAARIPANVSAAGIELGGMTQDEAETALLLATQNTYSSKSMVIQILDTTYELTPVDTGASLDVSALAKAAVQLPSGDAQVIDILPYMTLDQSAIQSAVEKLGREYNTEFVPSSYRLEGPDSASPAGQTLVLAVGAPGYTLDTEKLYNQILSAYNNNIFYVEAECEAQFPEPLDLDAFYEMYNLDPVDAYMDMETFEISEEVYGYGFDLDAAKASLAEAKYGDVIQITIEPMDPEITAETLRNTLFRDELSSSSTAVTSDANRNTNLRLACEAVNNLVLQPGDVFSFNQTLGERTAEKGYQPAGTYVGGDTVDTLGGGICQVASTIYYCALQADMEIVDRTCHMYAPSYLPYGMDATIYWGSLDFSFRNNTDYPLRIEAELSGGYVNVRLIGTDTKDYYVEMEYEIQETYSPNTVYKEMDPDNAEGYKDGDVITYPYTGYRVYTYRCKYDKATDALISREFEDTSVYDSRDKVVCKIIGNTEPTIPDIIIGGGVSEDPGD